MEQAHTLDGQMGKRVMPRLALQLPWNSFLSMFDGDIAALLRLWVEARDADWVQCKTIPEREIAKFCNEAPRRPGSVSIFSAMYGSSPEEAGGRLLYAVITSYKNMCASG
jgi:hypothetical protein